ncbi:MAG: ABC transporter permease, partial [Planctomycetota bacterium]
MLKLFLWFRYLHSRKIVFLSVAAVALSVALMIVVDSLFTGVIGKLEENSVADVGDIFLWPIRKAIPQYDILLDKLEKIDGIEAVAPFVFSGGLLHLESGDVREVMVHGIEPDRETNFTDWKEVLFRQKDSERELDFKVPDYQDDDGGWVGVGVIAEPNEKTDEYDLEQVQKWIGKRITLITTGLVKVKAGELIDGSGQKTVLWEKKSKRRQIKLRVSDVAFTKTYTGDRKLYLPFEQWHKIQYGDDESGCVRNIKIKLKPGADTESVMKKVTAVWENFAGKQLGWSQQEIPPLVIRMGEEFNSDYFAELRKQMRILLLIFGVICSVVVLLVFCIFYMIVE